MALIDELEKEGYDTSQITPELISQLQNEGYDVSGLASTQPREQPGLMNQAANAVGGPMQMIGETFTGLVQKGADKIGEFAAEDFAKHGMSPNAAAAIGTGLQMAPMVAESMIGVPAAKVGNAAVEASGVGRAAKAIKGAIKGPNLDEARVLSQEMRGNFIPNEIQDKAKMVGEQGIESARQALLSAKKEAADIAQTLSGKAGPALEKARELARSRISAVQQELVKVRQSGISIQSETAKIMDELKNLQGQAGKAMGEAEEAAGFAFKSTPEFEASVKNPEYVSKLAEEIGPIYDQGAEAVSKAFSPQDIQMHRKLFQESKDLLSNLGNAQIQNHRETAAEALEMADPGFKAARGKYLEAVDAMKELPKAAKAKSETVKKTLIGLQNKIKTEAQNAKEMIESVKASEKAAAKSRITEQQKKILELSERVQKAQKEAQRLMREARNADAARKRELMIKAREVMLEGVRNSQTLRKLKVIAGTAAGIVGLGGIAKFGTNLGGGR